MLHVVYIEDPEIVRVGTEAQPLSLNLTGCTQLLFTLLMWEKYTTSNAAVSALGYNENDCLTCF